MSLLITLYVLAAVCGCYAEQKISGGDIVDITYYPYQASVRVNGQHFCGGAVLAADKVLTAASCIVLNPIEGPFSVVAGGNFLDVIAQERPVQTIITHEKFDGTNNDIAVLVLETPFKLGNSIKPIGLVPFDFQEYNVNAFVSGWGNLVSIGHLSRELRGVTVDTMTSFKCQFELNNYFNCVGCFKISESMLCAGGSGPGFCVGDEGGPLVVKDGEITLLVGIASNSVRCGEKGVPQIYSSIKNLRSWILEHASY